MYIVDRYCKDSYIDNRAYESYGIWKWMHIQILRLEQKKNGKWKLAFTQ